MSRATCRREDTLARKLLSLATGVSATELAVLEADWAGAFMERRVITMRITTARLVAVIKMMDSVVYHGVPTSDPTIPE